MSNQLINDYRARHETVLHEIMHHANIPASRIRDAMNYALFPGGKRLRPILVYLCGEILGVALPTLDQIAAAIELTHCYSLVHDDLPAMDNDDFRRGKPSCHRAFDEATAILVGDGMQALAIDLLLSKLPHTLPMPHVVKVTLELVKASGPAGMVSGQSLDLTELAKPDIPEEQLKTIHLLKTGQLILTCVTMVLAASDTPSDTTKALRAFAHALGLAFQMQDDYLDKYGNLQVLGKDRASDTVNQKTTFASLYPEKKLSQLIEHYFQQAQDTLRLFDHRADPLRQFTEQLNTHLKNKARGPLLIVRS